MRAEEQRDDGCLRGVGGGGSGCGWVGVVALNTAEHRGVVVGGCITYSTLLQPIIRTLISHTLFLPARNLRTYIHLCPL